MQVQKGLESFYKELGDAKLRFTEYENNLKKISDEVNDIETDLAEQKKDKK